MNARPQGIVLGYDASPEADEATRWAAGAALLRGEPLVAVIAANPMDSARAHGGRPPGPGSARLVVGRDRGQGTRDTGRGRRHRGHVQATCRRFGVLAAGRG